MRFLELDRRHVAERFQEAVAVEPAHPFQDGELDVLDAVQAALAEERTAFGLLQAEKVKWSNARRRLFNAIQSIYADDRRKAEYFVDHAPISHKRNGKPPVEPPKPQQQSVERVVVGAVEAAGAAGALEAAGAVGVAASAA